MQLLKKLREGQDIEVDIDGNGNFRELRVLNPSYGPSILFGDKKDHLDKKSTNDNPEIKVIFLGVEAYKLDFKGRVIPSNNINIRARQSFIRYYNQNNYGQARLILEKESPN